jgi:2'-5' RNA ligase
MREAMAHATRKAVRASGGRPVPAENLHVTLAFLGSVAQRRLPELAEVAAAGGAAEPESGNGSSREEPLELAFDHLEYWRPAQLLCASPAAPSTRAAALAGRLQARLTEHGFAPDLKPFRAHVTVVRKVVRPGPVGKMQPVLWRFAELALVESRTLREGSLYSVVESYPLCGTRKGAK